MTRSREQVVSADGTSPWPALWALVIGFFMILVDATIVTVATPALLTSLDADVNSVVWVTSAYLLAYVVPLLVTGRLGDRFGPKRVYLCGLAVFTLASLWCGLTSTVGALIVARIAQGLGAAMMTPQTMAVITRTFPAAQRGRAMSLWGAVAGVATLTGPIVGGLLVGGLGWEWIFFVNVPVGVIAFVAAWRLVPSLETSRRRFDVVGVVLSALGMFLLVFGIQEGQKFGWSVGIWALIGSGVVVLVAFVWWQRVTTSEPLVTLRLFRDRNFSLANIAICTVGFAITAQGFPLMIYAQSVRGFTPTEAALLLAPLAIFSGALAPYTGRLTDRVHPRLIGGFGMATFVIALVWLAGVMGPDTPVWQLLLPLTLLGISNSCVWAPISTSATRNLPMDQAGSGSGVYNTTRQVGAVLGSAGIAVLMESRIAALVPGASTTGGSPEVAAAGGPLPEALRDPFATAMAQSMLLPAAVLVIGVVAVACFATPRHLSERRAAAAERAVSEDSLTR
ncbi:DHA2 family efflux MFS transporter permease subunit [Pseudonocardia sp. EV170527-09]|uniref:DHA2 family efflux MFS transporter permease subunit n=1 Tax=Pseudonocardia sp. EV170527-09 TaxID=2603411 RepID=UPI0011F12E8E|nr:DHA2 family efflux MFS transporter permease subunit [Pseudonocardia sp. EV170527-09]KAA1029850.1 DHA2 family efflux MFS transporter permease subunit [Pseudonocardia sp. EV170527-09]